MCKGTDGINSMVTDALQVFASESTVNVTVGSSQNSNNLGVCHTDGNSWVASVVTNSGSPKMLWCVDSNGASRAGTWSTDRIVSNQLECN